MTFEGLPLPGATVDSWNDEMGRPQWSARLLCRTGPAADEGELAGRTMDGRLLTGHALVAGREHGAGGRRETLVLFHGSGSLHSDGDLPA